MEVIIKAIDIFNDTLDAALPYVAIFVLVGAAIFYIWSIREEGFQRCLFLGVTFLFEEVIIVLLIWHLPLWIASWASKLEMAPILRWIVLFLGSSVVIYFLSRKYGGRRGIYSMWGHLSILFFGWWLDRWSGMLFISLPIMVMFYYSIYRIAVVVVPASDPDASGNVFKNLFSYIRNPDVAFNGEDKRLKERIDLAKQSRWRAVVEKIFGERWQRFFVLCWYMWGLQYPLLVVSDNAGRKIETRIDGSAFNLYGVPGLIWTRSHQVAGLTTGIQFARVCNPGVTFTRPYERPQEVIDLRTQLRTTLIGSVSKDGVPLKVIFFAAFAVDKDRWPHRLYNQLCHENPTLRRGMIPDYSEGSFPFSRVRIRATFAATGVKSKDEVEPASDDSKRPIVYWDERVVYQIENTANTVLSQYRLDELWRPNYDLSGVNSIDEIASVIETEARYRLQLWGIRLYTCRIVDLIFAEKTTGEEDKVRTQQIASWCADWEQEVVQAHAQGEADAELLRQRARAYAHSVLLNRIVDGLNQARTLNPTLGFSRYVVGMHFIGALEELIRQQAEGSKLNEWFRQYIREIRLRMPSEMSKD